MSALHHLIGGRRLLERENLVDERHYLKREESGKFIWAMNGKKLVSERHYLEREGSGKNLVDEKHYLKREESGKNE